MSKFSNGNRADQSREAKLSARLSDYNLAQKAAAGDIAAFEQIYRQHHRVIFCLCQKMINNAAEAEDVTQEIFIQLTSKIGTFRGESAFATWLHRITVNQVLMHFRKQKAVKEQTTEDGEFCESLLAENENPPAKNFVDRIALTQAIAELPKGSRKVFVLHDIQGFHHEEIAKLLGCAAGTSKSQLHKARKKLRGLLSHSFQNQELSAAF